MEIKTKDGKTVKPRFFINHVQGLWYLQIAVASAYLLATLIVDGNMQLLNFGRQASIIIIAVLTILGIVVSVCLMIIDKKRRRYSVLLLFMYILFSIPALI